MAAIHHRHHTMVNTIPVHSIMVVHMALIPVQRPMVQDIMHQVLPIMAAMYRGSMDLTRDLHLIWTRFLDRRKGCRDVLLNTDPLERQAVIALLNTALQAGFHISIVDW